MNIWYNGEQFRLLPNIEIWQNEGYLFFDVTWMKFVLELPIMIKCKY